MNESEIRKLVQEQLGDFSDPRASEAVEQWNLLVEAAPNGWLLYRVDADIGLAYSLSDNWAETPWAVVDGFSDSNPSVRTYCPNLEDAVRDIVYDGQAPPRQAETDARAAAMEKARQKRKKKGQ